MPDTPKLTTSLQENVLVLLCYDDTHGKIISNLVSPDLFEGDYRLIAEHGLNFWRRHNSAPKDHTPDFLHDILKGNTNSRRADLLRRVMSAMNDLAQSINAAFVMSQLTKFVRMQKLKSAIIESAEKINQDSEAAIENIEQIWSDLLKTQEIGFDAGMRLTEIDRLLEYLEKRPVEFMMGIGVLDKMGVVPARATLTGMHGVLGEGKTWFLVGVGKHNLRQQKKIVHFSLEMSEEDVIQRYVQSIWAIPSREVEKITLTGLRTENGRLKEFTERNIHPEFSFGSEMIKTELEARLEHMGAMATNLVVKRFPPRRVTDRQINAYLDALEATEKFIPDLLLFDAPYLYQLDMRNPRMSIEGHVIDTRATCIERNCAGVMAHWINREGAKAETRELTHTSEAWAINATLDQAMTLSKTRAEEEFGLARINVGKARTVRDKFEVLITQAFDIGQFCIDSVYMDFKTRDKLKELTKQEDEDDGGDSDADDE
jgi:replicative DNA helicase